MSVRDVRVAGERLRDAMRGVDPAGGTLVLPTDGSPRSGA